MTIRTIANLAWSLIMSICMVLFVSQIITGCIKLPDCVTYANGNEYLVELPIRLYPAKDTFDIGDTIWIEQNFHDQVHDQRNNMSLDFKNYSLGNWITTSDLLDFNNFPV